jgi:hypothetical protein
MALHLLERHMAHVFGVDIARLRDRTRDREGTRFTGATFTVPRREDVAEVPTQKRPEPARSEGGDAVEA